MVHTALQAAEILGARGLSARVLNVSSLKPLDREALLVAAAETAGILTLEDHSVIGGLGAAVAELLAEAGRGRLARIGVPDRFCESGDPDSLLAAYGLDARSVVDRATALLERRPPAARGPGGPPDIEAIGACPD